MAKKKNPSVQFSNDDAVTLQNHLPETLDTVICSNLFFYLKDKRTKAIRRWNELLNVNGYLIFIEEYPFITPKSEEIDDHTNDIMSVIDPISPEEIIEIVLLEGFILIQKEKIAIDKQHDLYGIVFQKR